MPTPTPQELLEALKQVKYPGFNRDIVDFGLVKDFTNIRLPIFENWLTNVPSKSFNL